MRRTQPPPMEKNQKEMGMTLSLLRSEAIHCTRKRLKKKPCPRNPMDSQNCSVVIISASLDSRRPLPRKAFAGRTSRRPPYRRRKDAARSFRTLHRFRGSGDYREDERAVRARHRVHASGRTPRVVAGAAHPRIVGHGALEHPDLLVAEMAMARHRGAGRIPHEHGLVPTVRVLPERLPEDAGASLDPRGLLGIGEEAHGRGGHDDLLCRLGGAHAFERVADGLPESFHGLRAHERPAVHEKGRRAGQLESTAFLHVGLDVLAELVRVETRGEERAVEAQAPGVGHQVVAREVRHREIEEIVVGPERALGRRAARRLCGGEGALVRGHGEVLVDVADLAVELAQDLVQGPTGALAGRALEVRELDDDHRGIHGPAREGRIDGEGRGVGGPRGAPQPRDEQEGRPPVHIMGSRHSAASIRRRGAPLTVHEMEATMGFLLRVVVNALAIMLAASIVHGISVDGLVPALVGGLLLGLVNAVVRPVLVILTLPITLVTLGLFLLVLNALCFWLVASLVKGFYVAGFWAAFLGAIVVSIVSWIMTALISDSGKVAVITKRP